MPVTIRSGQTGERIEHADLGPQEAYSLIPGKRAQVSPDEFETFGRLRLNVQQIASYYGISPMSAKKFYDKPQFRAAYDRGRAEIIMAVRQKQLKLALDGDRQMLLHAGKHFAEQEAEPISPEDNTGRIGHEWDDAVRERARMKRESLLEKIKVA